MSTVPAEAGLRLAEARVRAVIADGLHQARAQASPTLVSVAWPVPAWELLDVVARASVLGPDHYYWARPDAGQELATAGVAWSVSVYGAGRFGEASRAWRALVAHALIDAPDGIWGTGPLAMGGFAFDPARMPTSRWDGYPDGLLLLPRFALARSGTATWLTANMLLWPASDAERELRELRAGLEALGGQHAVALPASAGLELADELPAAAWQQAVADVVAELRRGSVDKVVLARAVHALGAQPFDRAGVLAQLRAQYPACFIFAVARGARCFLGASPERLVALHAGQVRASSLAGSTARGATPEADDHLGEALLASAKERAEHAIVAETLAAGLAEAGVELAPYRPPTLMKMPNVQHLYTPIEGRSRGDLGVLDLVARLHPTPAVGGYPRGAALAMIRAREQLDRGWYAGPVGWVDVRGEGEFAVAIRSALLSGSEATLFAGCGIVPDSDPEREYAESCLKLRPMISALGS